MFRNKTDHVQIDAIQVLVPTECRAMYRVLFHDMAKDDERLKLCDRAYLENDQLREIYYRQVIVYKRYLQNHYVIRIHGCSTPDMEAIMDDITLAGILSISPTDKLEQRGLWHLLAPKSLPQDSKQQIDDILTQLNYTARSDLPISRIISGADIVVAITNHELISMTITT